MSYIENTDPRIRRQGNKRMGMADKQLKARSGLLAGW
jgi:hypothetical protein